MKNRRFTKTALAVSVCLFALWWILGTGATLAWFTDTTETQRNELRIGLLNLEVSYRRMDQSAYTPMEGSSEVFSDEALYEPGYTQVVYLEIKNAGDVDLKYKLSVEGTQVNESVSVLGNTIYLPNYLKFGAVFADSEPALDRNLAQALAGEDMSGFVLGTWSDIDRVTVAAGETRYAALVVYMPKEVGNAANYLRGKNAPQIELGVTVFAQQADVPIQ